MDQVQCLKAVRNLIQTNEATLVSGFVHQGIAREIDSISFTPLVPPQAYYHVLIEITAAIERSHASGGNVKKPHGGALYTVSIHIADAAIQQQNDIIPYEIMTVDFRTLCDRLVGIIRDEDACFTAPPPDNESEFRLLRNRTGDDRAVRVENLDQNWYDAAGELVAGILLSKLTFTLEEQWVT